MQDSIIFEVIPPGKSASETHVKKTADKIAEAIKETKGISTLNIPEIVEENHLGLPYYRNLDNREFGLLLREKCGKNLIINTVVAHKPKDKFEKWLDESMNKYKIVNFVFVGAKINSIKYPGPSIIEANSIASKKNVNVGNILIPERENEAERMIIKTASGCNFFTSQVLFGTENIIKTLEDYSLKCEKSGLKPAKIFLSFAPVSSFEDIVFLRWLGVEIKQKTESRLKHSQNIGEESVKMISESLSEIFDYVQEKNIGIPLGLNIEYISLHNLELAKNLANIMLDFETPIVKQQKL